MDIRLKSPAYGPYALQSDLVDPRIQSLIVFFKSLPLRQRLPFRRVCRDWNVAIKRTLAEETSLTLGPQACDWLVKANDLLIRPISTWTPFSRMNLFQQTLPHFTALTHLTLHTDGTWFAALADYLSPEVHLVSFTVYCLGDDWVDDDETVSSSLARAIEAQASLRCLHFYNCWASHLLWLNYLHPGTCSQFEAFSLTLRSGLYCEIIPEKFFARQLSSRCTDLQLPLNFLHLFGSPDLWSKCISFHASQCSFPLLKTILPKYSSLRNLVLDFENVTSVTFFSDVLLRTLSQLRRLTSLTLNDLVVTKQKVYQPKHDEQVCDTVSELTLNNLSLDSPAAEGIFQINQFRRTVLLWFPSIPSPTVSWKTLEENAEEVIEDPIQHFSPLEGYNSLPNELLFRILEWSRLSLRQRLRLRLVSRRWKAVLEEILDKSTTSLTLGPKRFPWVAERDALVVEEISTWANFSRMDLFHTFLPLFSRLIHLTLHTDALWFIPLAHCLSTNEIHLESFTIHCVGGDWYDSTNGGVAHSLAWAIDKQANLVHLRFYNCSRSDLQLVHFLQPSTLARLETFIVHLATDVDHFAIPNVNLTPLTSACIHLELPVFFLYENNSSGLGSSLHHFSGSFCTYPFLRSICLNYSSLQTLDLTFRSLPQTSFGDGLLRSLARLSRLTSLTLRNLIVQPGNVRHPAVEERLQSTVQLNLHDLHLLHGREAEDRPALIEEFRRALLAWFPNAQNPNVAWGTDVN